MAKIAKAAQNAIQGATSGHFCDPRGAGGKMRTVRSGKPPVRGIESVLRHGVMVSDSIYHDGMRQLQDARETRPIADRLGQVTVRSVFTAEDRAYIERAAMFFIATADAEGRPDCSYKGGVPGFVRVLDERTLAIPDYDGNGIYRTWGNVLVNPRVGMLFSTSRTRNASESTAPPNCARTIRCEPSFPGPCSSCALPSS